MQENIRFDLIMVQQSNNKQLNRHQLMVNRFKNTISNNSPNQINQVNIFDTFNGITLVIDILIRITILSLFFDAFTSTFDGVNSNLNKKGKFKYNYVNNSNIITFVINMYTISGPVLIEFFPVDIHLIMQVMDILSLIKTVSIKFFTIIAIDQLILDLAVQSFINAGYSHTQVIHNVCAVFCPPCFILFLFFVFLS